MKLTVLGCSGGIGGSSAGEGGAQTGATGAGPAQHERLRTSSFLLDDDILIDAGTGVEDLTVPELARIDYVFLTHSHLDHICALPLMIDSVGGMRQRPLVVYALPETIEALKTHIFNWVIWPDFTEIPHYDRPWMKFEPISVGATVTIGERRIRPIAANHTVPAVGYHLAGPGGSIVYSGDTWPTAEFWRTVNGIRDLKKLIIETAFSNKEQDLAITAKHLYPVQLGQELANLRIEAEVLITHMKPSDRALIAQEIVMWAGRFEPRILRTGEVLVV